MSGLRIAGLEVLEVQFPFRISFGHALASRSSSRNVIVAVRTEDGTTGYGESVPREYVTGETPAGAAALIAERLGPAVLGRQVERFEDTPALLREAFGSVDGAEPSGAARCALELAVLDASGRRFGRSVGELLGPLLRPTVAYSGVLPLLPAPLMLVGALAHLAFGVRTVKLKVGRSLDEDLRNLKIVRRAMGGRADVRVDANCAWQPDQAIDAIRAMQRYRLGAVEQPVEQNDFAGLKRVADAVAVPIMADESLRTMEDARRLAADRSVDMFNIRISKCGGLLAAKEMAEIAAGAGLGCQMGAHPGESAILAAAGRHFATRVANLRYLEGSAGTILLKQDIADRNVQVGWGARAPALDGPGLGLEINRAKLEQFVVARRRVGRDEG